MNNSILHNIYPCIYIVHFDHPFKIKIWRFNTFYPVLDTFFFLVPLNLNLTFSRSAPVHRSIMLNTPVSILRKDNVPDGDLCLAGLCEGAGEHGAEVGRTRGKDNLQAYGLDKRTVFFFVSRAFFSRSNHTCSLS